MATIFHRENMLALLRPGTDSLTLDGSKWKKGALGQ
jgi:hypothetical protein